MGNFFEDVIQKDPRYRSVEPVKDANLLEPVTRAAVRAVIAAAHDMGHTLVIAETYRSAERQVHLYEQHLTQLRDVGVHRYGLAVDLALYVNGEYDGDGEHYLFLRTLFEQHGMISGIDWGAPRLKHSFRDWDHGQRISVVRQRGLFENVWYPDENYRPLADLGNRQPTPINASLIVVEAA